MPLVVDSYFFKPKDSSLPSASTPVASNESATLKHKIDEQVSHLQTLWQTYETQQSAPLHQTIQQQCDELQNLLTLVPFTTVTVEEKKLIELQDFVIACRLSLEQNRPLEESAAAPLQSSLTRVSVSGNGNNCAIHSAMVSLGHDQNTAETLAPLVRGNVAARIQAALHFEVENSWNQVENYKAPLFSSLAKEHHGDPTEARRIIDEYCYTLANRGSMFDHLSLRFLAEELGCKLLVLDPTKGDSDLLQFGSTASDKSAVISYDQKNLHYSAMVKR